MCMITVKLFYWCML